MHESTVVRAVRPLLGPNAVGASDTPVDILIEDGVITAIGTGLAAPGATVHDGGGAFVIPGLWDGHVHMDQWSAMWRRFDLEGTTGPEQVLALVAGQIAAGAPEDTAPLEGFGWRLGSWTRLPSTAELDAVSGERPVVLISGDCHGGWMNSAAYRALGETPRPGHVDEDEWFAIFARLGQIPGSDAQARAGLQAAMRQAAAKGVVGITDLEFADGRTVWPQRVAAGLDTLRVRPATYPPGLEATIDQGLRTGDILDDRGLVTMGPLKVISDGSLNTRTAWCCEPFVTDDLLPEPFGKCNVPPDELTELLGRAHAHGLEVAVHAIGDAALAGAIEAMTSSGARGSIEHAQLVRLQDLATMAELGVVASVQPAHLLDDRDTTELLWPDRADRCFAFASMLRAGVALRLGSDAPVAPLDPWHAMAAAVHRSADQRPPWTPAEAITPEQALAASVDGRMLAVGEPADLALLGSDPFGPVDLDDAGATGAAADRLRSTSVLATVLGGRVTHSL